MAQEVFLILKVSDLEVLKFYTYTLYCMIDRCHYFCNYQNHCSVGTLHLWFIMTSECEMIKCEDYPAGDNLCTSTRRQNSHQTDTEKPNMATVTVQSTFLAAIP